MPHSLRKLFSCFFACGAAFCFYGSSFAQSAANSSYKPSSYFMNDSLANSSKEASLSVNAISGLSIDPFTGSSNLNIPLLLPPGRAGMEPRITLNYSPSNPNGILGLGWRLDLGYVERSTKGGIPKYNSNDSFNFCLFGTVSELVSTSGSSYRPKRDPQNYQFTFDGANWSAKDKQGRTFYFGDSATLRANSGMKFRWNLTRVEDAKGNFIDIEYESRQGSGVESTECNPVKIYYTRNKDFTSAAEICIEFSYGTTAPRDLFSSYRPGFYISTAKRLTRINAWLKEGVSKKLIKSFVFTYKYSSLSNRSLLTKITEFGSDGLSSLPPLTFAYQETAGPAYTIIRLKDNSRYFGDFNGDGLTDLGSFNSDAGEMIVRLSTGNGFAAGSSWITGFGQFSNLMLGDFNGDGRIDLCAFRKSANRLYFAISDGRKFMQSNTYVQFFNKGNAVFAAEIDGDAFTDLVEQTSNGELGYYKNPLIDFKFEGWERLSATFDKIFFGDFNAEGISDFCEFSSATGAWKIRPLKKPSLAWVATPSGSVSFGAGKGVFPLDANNDGLTDAGYYDYTTGKIWVKIFNGKIFAAAKEVPAVFSLRGGNTKIQSADFNGDGIADYAVYSGGVLEIAYSRGKFTDLLSGVNNGIGAALQLFYKPSSNYTNKRSDGTAGLPFVAPVFYRSRVADGRGNAYITTYSYMAGLYDDENREFAGFGYCSITDNDGNYTERYFLQDKPLRGKLAKELVKDKNGNTFLKVENSWAVKELFPDVNLAYLAQTDSYTYDGDETFRQARVRYTYDDFGNPLTITYDGDPAVTGDEKTQAFEYSYNTRDSLLSLPASTYLLDNSGRKVSEKRFYYDGASVVTTTPSKGLLTKEEVWLKNPLSNEEKFLSTQYGYDSLGNLTNVTDALGRSSTIEYDSQLLQYPLKKTNALGQTSRFTYNYGTGKILSSTGPNNNTVTYKYDALGRLSKVIGPYDSEALPGIIYGYNLASRPTYAAVWARTMPLGAAGYGEYSFYDGLGRLIQTKTLSENAGYQVASGVVKFDSQGRVKEKYLPYLAAKSNLYSPPKTSQSKAVFDYDCLGRLLKTTNPDGTSNSTTYADWVTTFIDENGHYKYSYQDAYGQVAKVEEQNNGQAYTTNYEYDPLGDLNRIIDDQNNSTRFYYDSLGRKIRTDDPDMGIWNYEYDDAGNLLRQTDAKGQILEFAYDALNRLINKKGLSPEGGLSLNTYIYDDPAKPNCLGRLSKITDSSGSTEFFYDKLGRQIKVIKIISGWPYTTERSYDALGRVLTIKYPDASVVKYTYNPQGIETVSQISPTAAKFVSAVSYSPSGQMAKISYGNGAITSYTYDPKTLRMTTLAAKSLKGKLQDLKYQFDAVGNISAITDNLNTVSSQDFLYDGLNRLVQARGNYGTATYAYDSIGNLVSKEGVSFAYGQGGAGPHALTSASDGSSFTYDENGNLSEEVKPSGKRIVYGYDIQNRLARVGPQKREYAFTLSLRPGWNFISLPVTPKDTNILQVLKPLKAGVDYDQVARYNPTTKTWEMFSNQPEFDQFSTLEYGRGYQIFITNPNGATLTVSGYLTSSETAIPVSNGWNLVGFPYWGVSAKGVEAGLSPLKLGTDFDTVERYNASSARIEKYTASLKQFSELNQGEAYFVKALKDSSLRAPGQDTDFPADLSEYTYDDQGSRVLKVTAAGATVYVGGIFEQDSNGTTRKHIFAGAQRVCTIAKGLSPQGTVPDEQFTYYHSDHLGSSNVISDATGKEVAGYEYTPFGSLTKGLSPQGTVPASAATKYLFTGKELDSTGLYYYGARYYNPATAHFTQPDPLLQNIYDPQTLNHYSYCRNNPLIYTDPTGMSWGNIFSNMGTTFSSWSTSLSNTWNSWGSSISSGISTISNWGTQIWNSGTQGLMDTWNISQQFASDFGQSVVSGAKVGGNAFITGVNYAVDYYTSGYQELYRTQKDVQWWTKYSGLNQNTTTGPRLEIGFSRIPSTDTLHTFLRISDYPHAGDVGAWGFNPRSFSSGTLMGISAPGVVKFETNKPIFSIVISNNPEIIRQVYNSAERARYSPAPNYLLFGQGKYNCYNWRDQTLKQVGLPVSPWSDE